MILWRFLKLSRREKSAFWEVLILALQVQFQDSLDQEILSAKKNKISTLNENIPHAESDLFLFSLARLKRHVPLNLTCLEECVLALRFFKKRGLNLNINLGARQAGEGYSRHREIHAWIYCGDQVLAGDHEKLSEFRGFL